MIQFPETQSKYSNERFQQKIEQGQSSEELKTAAKDFLRVTEYTQNSARLIGGATILLSLMLLILLAVNSFMMRKMKKVQEQKDA